MHISADNLDSQTGRRLREIREAAGLTQKQLAERSGHSVESIQLSEAGKRRPSANELWELCAVLGSKPHEFFEV